MDRGPWWATVHRIAKSRTRLKQLRLHTPSSKSWCPSQDDFLFFRVLLPWGEASQVALGVKNSPANEGDVRAAGLSPWVGKIPWRRAWQRDSCLENPVDRGPWWATAQWVMCRAERDWSDLACTCMHPPGSWELGFSLQWHFLSPDYFIPGPPSLLGNLVLGDIFLLDPQRFLSPQRFGSLLTLTLTLFFPAQSGEAILRVSRLGGVCVCVCVCACVSGGRQIISSSHSFSSVQSFSRVQLFETPWTAARQAFLSITNSQSPPKHMSIESVMLSNHLILCRLIN